MATNLCDYVVKLLDKVQGNEELNVILNQCDSAESGCHKTKLARLQLAIDYKEKKVRPMFAIKSCVSFLNGSSTNI